MASNDIEQLMKGFHAEIGSEKLGWLMEQFSGNKTLKELFQLLWDVPESHQCLSVSLIKSTKCSEKAEKFRIDGNKFYKQRDFEKALRFYNMSIMNAQHPEYSKLTHSNSLVNNDVNTKMKMVENESVANQISPGKQEDTALALGFANRSAVLFEMELYEKCLEDINWAMTHGYPESSMHKLEKRRQKCIDAKKRQCKPRVCYLPENCRSVLQQILSSYFPTKLPELEESNSTMPSFSSSVTIAFSPDKGRHIVAVKDIRPGDLIAIEQSYCHSLDWENMGTYCNNCLVRCLIPLPCPYCSLVVFCSERCRQQAVFGDHWLECTILNMLSFLVLRPVFSIVYKLLKYPSYIKWKTALEGLQERERHCSPEELGLNEEGIYSPTDYESIYHLVTNKEKRPSGDLYVKCLIAFILTDLLKQSKRFFVDYFGNPFDPGKEDLLLMGETLFSNLMKISCNGFQLVEFQCTGPPVTLSRATIGSGVFPTLSLVNHSCDPSTTTYVYGRTQVIRASRCISPGEEITESYCQTFYQEGEEERQMGLLEVYQFTCHCEACQKKWPTYKNLPKEMHIKCLDCSRPVGTVTAVCNNCKLDYSCQGHEISKQLSVNEWWNTVKKVKEAFENSQKISGKLKSSQPPTMDDFLIIRDAMETLDKYVISPCQQLWDIYDTMDLYFRLSEDPIFSYLQDYE
ncbi:SET and MYND domain-containing protein 4-like isoform X1 [Macrobrachium nipponense]|uniref:SET and MYND domain-containing protein 4-like isoform X1 n=1 Tax=Macrobrachium nipponense TaxID=159736 RepID=UPI0030C81C79